LGVVTERHVLAESEHSAGAENMLDIHARRVHLYEREREVNGAADSCQQLLANKTNLIVESEALLFADTALSKLEHSACGAYEDHLAIKLVQEYHALEVLEAVGQQVLCHLLIV
jgi:hypothetical protein